jgi:hypothetical protein
MFSAECKGLEEQCIFGGSLIQREKSFDEEQETLIYVQSTFSFQKLTLQLLRSSQKSSIQFLIIVVYAYTTQCHQFQMLPSSRRGTSVQRRCTAADDCDYQRAFSADSVLGL